MPQMQLPIFPAGVTEINHRIAVQKEAGKVCYIHGHLPVFQHEEQDVRSFRMFTSQMIVGGTVKPKEIVQTFGVPMITVKRYAKRQEFRRDGRFRPKFCDRGRTAARGERFAIGNEIERRHGSVR